MRKSWTTRLQAETSRCDVFSSASSRAGVGLFVTRCVDFFGESPGVRQGALDEHAGPPEVARRLLYGSGFLVHREHFPHRDAMAGQVRLAARKRIAKGNSGKLGFETLFDDVSRDEIAL